MFAQRSTIHVSARKYYVGFVIFFRYRLSRNDSRDISSSSVVQKQTTVTVYYSCTHIQPVAFLWQSSAFVAHRCVFCLSGYHIEVYMQYYIHFSHRTVFILLPMLNSVQAVSFEMHSNTLWPLSWPPCKYLCRFDVETSSENHYVSCFNVGALSAWSENQDVSCSNVETWSEKQDISCLLNTLWHCHRATISGIVSIFTS